MKFFSYLNNESLLNESINDRGLYKAVFTAGSPGAGKSYTISKIKSGQIEPRIVNVDKWTEFLNIHDIYSVYNKSKRLSVNQFTHYVNGVLPLFIDTTGVIIELLRKRVNIIEKLGYDVALVFVNTSLETALRRAEKRTRKVDPDAVKEYYEKSLQFKNDIKSFFSFSIEINNDDGELTDEVITKAFKKISYFYDTDVENPVGKKNLQLMRENNWKYLDPNIMTLGEIRSELSNWYGR